MNFTNSTDKTGNYSNKNWNDLYDHENTKYFTGKPSCCSECKEQRICCNDSKENSCIGQACNRGCENCISIHEDCKTTEEGKRLAMRFLVANCNIEKCYNVTKHLLLKGYPTFDGMLQFFLKCSDSQICELLKLGLECTGNDLNKLKDAGRFHIMYKIMEKASETNPSISDNLDLIKIAIAICKLKNEGVDVFATEEQTETSANASTVEQASQQAPKATCSKRPDL